MTTFTIPYNVPSLNKTSRQHWRARMREVNLCANLARVLGREVSKATVRRLVTITSYRRQLCRDIQNLIGGCKSLNDGLVRAGLLVDDSDRWATFTYRQHVLSEMPPELARKYGRRPVTVIEIEDVSPAG
jgi:hypothetical protein